MFPKVISLSLVIMCLAGTAYADSAKLLGKSGDWESFSFSDKSGKVCYMASLPKKSLNKPKVRGEPHLTSDRPVGG